MDTKYIVYRSDFDRVVKKMDGLSDYRGFLAVFAKLHQVENPAKYLLRIEKKIDYYLDHPELKDEADQYIKNIAKRPFCKRHELHRIDDSISEDAYVITFREELYDVVKDIAKNVVLFDIGFSYNNLATVDDSISKYREEMKTAFKQKDIIVMIDKRNDEDMIGRSFIYNELINRNKNIWVPDYNFKLSDLNEIVDIREILFDRVRKGFKRKIYSNRIKPWIDYLSKDGEITIYNYDTANKYMCSDFYDKFIALIDSEEHISRDDLISRVLRAKHYFLTEKQCDVIINSMLTNDVLGTDDTGLLFCKQARHLSSEVEKELAVLEATMSKYNYPVDAIHEAKCIVRQDNLLKIKMLNDYIEEYDVTEYQIYDKAWEINYRRNVVANPEDKIYPVSFEQFVDLLKKEEKGREYLFDIPANEPILREWYQNSCDNYDNPIDICCTMKDFDDAFSRKWLLYYVTVPPGMDLLEENAN